MEGDRGMRRVYILEGEADDVERMRYELAKVARLELQTDGTTVARAVKIKRPMSVPEAARLLGVDQGTIRKMAVEGDLTGTMRGSKWSVERDEVLEMARKGCPRRHVDRWN